MTDKAHALTDKEIERMERHLSVIYRKAEKSVSAEMAAYVKTIKGKADKLLKSYNDSETESDKKAAKMAYIRFYTVDVKRDARFKKLQQKAADTLYNANKEAANHINSKTANIYAENYNQIGRGLQQDLDGYAFKPVSVEDADAFGQITRQTVDKEKDTKWNAKNIVKAVVAGAVLMEAADKVFGGASKRTTQKNRDSAYRQASDTATDAESKGRLDSMYRASDEGWDVKKTWVATLDNRTRDTHREYDGVPPVDLDYEYAPGLKKPRDPDCPDLAEVCNCRCSIQYTVGKNQTTTRAAREGDVMGSYKRPRSFRGTETVIVPDMSYEEWMKWRSR